MAKTIFITGSSSGIGQATAYAFAKEGWNVVVTYYSSKKSGEETAKECTKLGASSVLLVKLNVLDDKSIKDAFKKIKSEYKTIDVLINNAGVVVWQPFKDYSYKEIEYELRTNLEGLIKVTSTFLPITKQAIGNISSVLGYLAAKDVSVYCASKWGVRGFVKSIALEHPELFCFSVNPGYTATKMTDFVGIPPSKVASLILEAIKGERKIESGGDINVTEIYPN